VQYLLKGRAGGKAKFHEKNFLPFVLSNEKNVLPCYLILGKNVDALLLCIISYKDLYHKKNKMQNLVPVNHKSWLRSN
jgi:hypothetical protein